MQFKVALLFLFFSLGCVDTASDTNSNSIDENPYGNGYGYGRGHTGGTYGGVHGGTTTGGTTTGGTTTGGTTTGGTTTGGTTTGGTTTGGTTTGGTTTGGTTGGSGSGINAGIFEGDWISGVCAPNAEGGSARAMLIMTKLNQTTISFMSDLYMYAPTNCPSNTGAPRGGPHTPYGTIVFDTKLGVTGRTFLKGTWNQSTGTQSRVVWALKSPTVLCLISDLTPTIFPTGASINTYVNLMTDEICYHKR